MRALKLQTQVAGNVPAMGRGAPAASLLVHGLLIAALALVAPPELPVPPVRAISVELLPAPPTPQPAPEATAIPAVPTEPPPAAGTGTARLEAPPAASAPPAPAATPADGTVVARTFAAARILAEPGMARIRATMGTLVPQERLTQLCYIEAIEQIRAAAPDYAADSVVSYAMADPTISGLTLTATGAAFRSRRKWYGLSFTCTAAAGLGAVTAFAFRIGAPIPQAEWDAHDLIAEDAD